MSAADQTDKGLRDDALRLLLERRAELYGRVAALLMDIEGGLAIDDWEHARFHLEELRRTLRTSLAFLTAEVYEELEAVEALCDVSGGRVSAERPDDVPELQDRLQLLHVKLARSLRSSNFQDLAEIVGMDLRLKRKLEASRKQLAEKTKRREELERAWELEAEARAHIAADAPRKALKALQEAVKLDPLRAVFYNDLGFVHGQLDDPESAVAAYRKAVEVNEAEVEQRSDEWSTSYFNLGIALRRLAMRCYRKQKRDEALVHASEALQAFEKYLSVTPMGSKVAYTRSALVQLSEVVEILSGDSKAELGESFEEAA